VVGGHAAEKEPPVPSVEVDVILLVAIEIRDAPVNQ
jgi:hypothetical protein